MAIPPDGSQRACDLDGREGQSYPLTEICDTNLQELRRSRRTVKRTNGALNYELMFILIGAATEEEARCRVENSDIGIYVSFRNQERINYTLEPVGYATWLVTANYGTGAAIRGGQEIDNSIPPTSVSFSTTGGTANVKQSVAIMYRQGADIPPDSHDVINMDQDTVQGVAVVTAKTRYTEVWSFSWAEVFGQPGGIPQFTLIDPTRSQQNLLMNWMLATGTVHGNKEFPAQTIEPFRGWETGETLFLGCTGRESGDNMIEVTFEFEVRPTVKNFKIPSSISGGGTIDRIEGWDYTWYRYEKTTVESDEVPLIVPKQIFVSRVYERNDFNQVLGIGLASGWSGSAANNLVEWEPCGDEERTTWEEANPRYGVDWDAEACAPAPA